MSNNSAQAVTRCYPVNKGSYRSDMSGKVPRYLADVSIPGFRVAS